MANQAGLQQPNFHRMRTNLNELGEDIDLFGNVPAIQQGNNLATALQAIFQRLDRIDQRLDGMDQRFNAVDQRFNGLERRIDNGFRKMETMNFNQQASLNNSFINQNNPNDERLIPLRSLQTNQEIPNFPASVADVLALSVAQIRPLLAALEIPDPRTLDEKRKAFLRGIGVYGAYGSVEFFS